MRGGRQQAAGAGKRHHLTATPGLPTLPLYPSTAGAMVEGCEHPIPQLEGDFSLNAANAISADLLLRAGLT